MPVFDNSFSRTIQLRVHDDFLERIDLWVAQRDEEISRSEAIRLLVKIGLNASETKGITAKDINDKLDDIFSFEFADNFMDEFEQHIEIHNEITMAENVIDSQIADLHNQRAGLTQARQNAINAMSRFPKTLMYKDQKVVEKKRKQLLNRRKKKLRK